ncbi:head-tail connector protein [Halobacillus ihumii]|uniref:head-tail connector protein n=1 Tax=Halobacillus ihumii TaxID=2686092 RepID=UPI0013D4E63B|nr:head-tail connector protein [Halobacillus ihumii]
MHVKVITEPTAEPLTVADAQEYLHLDQGQEDDTVKRIIAAARRSAEKFTRRSLAVKTYELILDERKERIKIPNPPLQTIDKVSVKDRKGNVIEVTDFYVSESEPAILLVEWPDVELYPIDAFKVQYTAGYETLPEDIGQAIHLLVSHFYENREAVIVGTSVVKIPFSIESLLYPYKGWF